MLCEDIMTWRKRPVIYEIATWVWLDELRSRYGQTLTLATIPAQEWDALADLMGAQSGRCRRCERGPRRSFKKEASIMSEEVDAR